MASRCQVAHDFTQRHVLAACGEAAIPAPRYLELATQNWFCSGRGRPRAHFFKMLTRRLSLVDDWFDSLIVVHFREMGIYASGFRQGAHFLRGTTMAEEEVHASADAYIVPEIDEEDSIARARMESEGRIPPWRAEILAAKEDASRQFAQMLARPEDLARLGELREEVAARLHKSELDLAAGLDAAADDMRFGLEALHTAREAVVKTRQNFSVIDSLCEEESSGLADHHDVIRDLAVMRTNLAKTVADSEAILALPAQAAAALRLLDDDERNLFACWEQLTELAMRAQPARAALETALRRDAYARSSGAGPRPVTEHFSAVDDAMSQLEETILSSIRGSVFAGEEGCRTLVRALRVVEEQETLDALLSTKAREQRSRFFGDDSSGTILGKGFKRRALREVRKAISEKITEALKELHPPAGEVGETSFFDDVPETLRNLEILMRVLTEAYDYAVPAFPPKYRVFESVIAPSWHRHVTAVVKKLFRMSRDLSNADIIGILNWYQRYTEQMEALGVVVEAAPSELPATPSTPPAPVPMILQTSRRTGAPPPRTKTVVRPSGEEQSGFGNESGDDSPSMMSLDAFLATAPKAQAANVAEKDKQQLHTVCVHIDEDVVTPLQTRPGNLGPGDETAEFDEESDTDEMITYPEELNKLVGVYTSRMAQTVQIWSSNIQKMAATQPLREAEDGTLWTASDVEFFRLLNEQLEVALSGGKQCVSAAASVMSSSLLEFASQQRKRLGGEAAAAASSSMMSSPSQFRRVRVAKVEKDSDEQSAFAAARVVDYNVLLAGVNDANRCHALATEVESLLIDALGSSDALEKLALKGNSNHGVVEKGGNIMQPALDAFLRNAEHSASAAAATVICDPSVVDLFGHLFLVDKAGGGDWIQGEVTETLAATIADYLEDVQQYVAREHACKVIEAVLSRVINFTIEACLRQLTLIRPGTVERMEADENALRECFEDHVEESVLESALQRFSAIRDLASADDAESFVLAYGLLVRSAPELGLEPAERLLAAREDIPRAAQREVLDQCRELIRSVTVSTSAR